MTELYKKYRPRKLSNVVGQPQAVAALEKFLEADSLPHTLLFHGPPGTGKTTLARILRKSLGCHDLDYREVNAAKERGIDGVRHIDRSMRSAPLSGKCKVYTLDEAHRLTPDAQTALLKMLEDTPKHVYFFLCTTHPQSLLPTIRSRCTDVPLQSVSEPELTRLLVAVLGKEKVTFTPELLHAVCEAAEYSPRKALVIANQVMALDDADRLEAVAKADRTRQARELLSALLYKKKKWLEVAQILAGLDDAEEMESLRRLVLTAAANVLLKADSLSPRAHLIVEAFKYPFFDSGKAGLVAACYDIAVLQK
jgi:DNA polymerase III gamma/tau subunit